jgi:uncharacterized protein YaaW (UPF0174 family)
MKYILLDEFGRMKVESSKQQEHVLITQDFLIHLLERNAKKLKTDRAKQNE